MKGQSGRWVIFDETDPLAVSASGDFAGKSQAFWQTFIAAAMNPTAHLRWN